jgi:predicted flap endonuclease-1-like 5' DNA nuclease
MTKLTKIEGIGEVYSAKLREAGVDTVEKLLDAGATPKGRETLEETTGIGHKLILEWVNLADLMRISGVGEEYADLLEEAGVDTVKELRRRNSANLYAAMVEVNGEKNLVRRLPSQNQVAAWIEQAKTLEPKVTY